MAAQNIAFESPDNSASVCPSSTRPIDLVHLARQTMGDKALEMEVLQIFARQARTCLSELGMPDAEVGVIAHRLKGAASAVGAHEIASLATRLEEQPADASILAATGVAIIAAENFILKLCR